LEAGGQYQWRSRGEKHLFNPETIHKLQYSARLNNYDVYKEYAELINKQDEILQFVKNNLPLLCRGNIVRDANEKEVML